MLVYMALQVAVEYCIYVTVSARELLPHVFTLTTVARGGYFLLPLARTFARLCFPQCNALSCPDFPPNFLSDRTARRDTKVKKTQLSHNKDPPFWKSPHFPNGHLKKRYFVREIVPNPERNVDEMHHWKEFEKKVLCFGKCFYLCICASSDAVRKET